MHETPAPQQNGTPPPQDAPFYLVTFQSTHAALTAIAKLEAQNPRVIPTPRTISANCGMAIKLRVPSPQVLNALMQSIGLPQESYNLYAINNQEYSPLDPRPKNPSS